MIPLLAVALLVLAGVFAFAFGLERKVGRLERRLEQLDTPSAPSEENR
jgi:hypothetical protein